MKKLIVISAPSGAGKTTIVRYLLKNINLLSFSISATTRKKRPSELNKKDYYFLTIQDFESKIKQGSFIEWEEVYKDQYYGTLKSEVDKIWERDKCVIFDIDVNGGISIKKKYPNRCLSIFIMPPSISDLEKRIKSRGSESSYDLETRIKKASQEINCSNQFDKIVLNKDLKSACNEAEKIVLEFLNQ